MWIYILATKEPSGLISPVQSHTSIFCFNQNAFEKFLSRDLGHYVKTRSDSADYKYKSFMKPFIKNTLSKAKEIEIIDMGALNQKRSLGFQGGKPYIMKPTISDIGATVTDVTVKTDGKPHHLSLKMGGTVTFFNAGVTFINYQRWVEKKFTDNLTNWMNYLGNRVMWYDQDVLNSYLNGMYSELPLQLNFTDIYLPISEVKEEAIFYHFWGKKKPWTVKGFLFYGESFYQRVYRSIFEENYHIVHRYKKDSLKHFIIFVFTLKIFRLKSPIRFIKNFIFSFGD